MSNGCLAGHAGDLRALVALNHRRVISASDDQKINVWDVIEGTCVQTLKGHSSPVMALAALGPGRLVSAAEDGKVRL